MFCKPVVREIDSMVYDTKLKVSSMHASCPTHLILSDLATLTILGEGDKL